jgi:hypothetical protein
MSNNMKVLTVLLYINLYTIICTHTELLNDIDSAQMLYHVAVYFLSPTENKISSAGDDRHFMFLISPISNYFYDLTKILSAERVVTQ